MERRFHVGGNVARRAWENGSSNPSRSMQSKGEPSMRKRPALQKAMTRLEERAREIADKTLRAAIKEAESDEFASPGFALGDALLDHIEKALLSFAAEAVKEERRACAALCYETMVV